MEYLKFKIGIVEYDFESIIDSHIGVQYRDEYKYVLEKLFIWNDMRRFPLIMELIVYVERGMDNIFCQHLDYIKYCLMKDKQINEDKEFMKLLSGNHDSEDDDFYFDTNRFYK